MHNIMNLFGAKSDQQAKTQDQINDQAVLVSPDLSMQRGDVIGVTNPVMSSTPSFLQSISQTMDSVSPGEIATGTVGGVAGGILLGVGTFMLLPYLPPAAGLMAMLPSIVPLAPVVTMAGYAVTTAASIVGASGGVRLSSALYGLFGHAPEAPVAGEPVAETSNSTIETQGPRP